MFITSVIKEMRKEKRHSKVMVNGNIVKAIKAHPLYRRMM